jgi:hypothetical protein
MGKHQETWRPTDHACRECGGRVVQVTNAGPTGGGNPLWRCADCGIGSADTGPSCLCFCGFRHKGQDVPVYMCVRVDRAKYDSAMKLALMRNGYDVEGPRRLKSEIAVIGEDSLRWAAEKIAEKAREGRS